MAIWSDMTVGWPPWVMLLERRAVMETDLKSQRDPRPETRMTEALREQYDLLRKMVELLTRAGSATHAR